LTQKEELLPHMHAKGRLLSDICLISPKKRLEIILLRVYAARSLGFMSTHFIFYVHRLIAIGRANLALALAIKP